MRIGRIAIGGVLFLLLMAAACGSAEDERFPADKLPAIAERYRKQDSAPRTAPAPSKDFPGQAAYTLAKQAVFYNNMELAIQHLDQAISENPDFAEAWYQRGAAKANLAIHAVGEDESSAMSLFRDAVADKRQAQTLFDANSFFVWTPAQQDEARSDLENGLADVDEFLNDDEKLVMALKLYAGGMR